MEKKNKTEDELENNIADPMLKETKKPVLKSGLSLTGLKFAAVVSNL